MLTHIALYLFEHRAPIVEVQAARKKMEAQNKSVAQLEKTIKELRPRVDFIM